MKRTKIGTDEYFIYFEKHSFMFFFKKYLPTFLFLIFLDLKFC